MPPPPSRVPTATVGRSFETWGAFDAAFHEWEERASREEQIRLRDVPFPPARDPAGLGELRHAGGGAEAVAQRKKLLRKALLRWHPDKWMALCVKMADEEKAALGERLSAITQALVELKDA